VVGSGKWRRGQDAEERNTDNVDDNDWTPTSLVCDGSTDEITNEQTSHEQRLDQVGLVRIATDQTPLQNHTQPDSHTSVDCYIYDIYMLHNICNKRIYNYIPKEVT